MNFLLFKLLKKSFLVIFIINFLIFLVLGGINIAISTYDNYLKSSFATKQHHITLKFIDENKSVNIMEEIKKISSIKEIKTLNSFVQKEYFIKLQRGLATFRGKVEIIGLGFEKYPITYDFNMIDTRSLSDLKIKLTGIELFYLMRNNNFVIFNKTLQRAFLEHLPSTSTKYGLFFNEFNKVGNVVFVGVLNDLRDKSVLFMNKNLFNNIFHYEPNHINGFFINVYFQKNLNNVVKKLKQLYPNEQIFTWRDENIKQNSILIIFSKVAKIIEVLLLFLAFVAIIVVLFNEIIKKQPQIRILNILGIRLIKYVNMVLFIIMLMSGILGVLCSKFISNYFMLEGNFELLAGIVFINALIIVAITSFILNRKIDLLR